MLTTGLPNGLRRADPRVQPHIVGCFPELRADIDHPHYIIQAFCKYGDLEGYKKILNGSQVESMAAQVSSALQYSHNLGIVHRDLKPANVIVASVEPFIVKVTDFGLADWGPWTAYVGTPLYVAPEMTRNQDGFQFTAKVDIWSLGMMQLEFSTIDQLPSFCPAFNPEHMLHIRPPEQSSFEWDHFFGQLRTARPKPGFEHLTSIANKMLIVDPSLRPSAEACARFLDEHRKCVILPWVIVDKTRSSAVTVCISALLEYGSVKREIRRQLLRKLAKLKGSFEISYTDTKEREPGLYVPSAEALNATQKYIPSLKGVLQQVINERSS